MDRHSQNGEGTGEPDRCIHFFSVAPGRDRPVKPADAPDSASVVVGTSPRHRYVTRIVQILK
jgi:hypothetical protein